MTLGGSLAASINRTTWGPLSLTSGENELNNLIFDNVVSRKLLQYPSEFIIRTQEALVNYSIIRQLAREYIPKASSADLVKYSARIKGRVVLIGDLENARDRYPIPGHDMNFSGVLLHAAQVHTLTTEPIYEFGHNFRVCVDFMLPLGVMLTVIFFRLRASAVDGASVPKLETKLLMWIGIFVAGIALGLAAFLDIFWPDFILVIVFLLLHKPTEHRLVNSLQRRWGVI
jgi:CHASE2 domain-containing sensor protein